MKVISYSLWGDNPIYIIGAIRNAELAREIYPGWECWFYVGTSVPVYIISRLSMMNNVKVITMSDYGDWTSMFWRFYPASNLEVDVMVSRDTDSRLSYRESEAVASWLKGDKLFHIMRDHPYHNTKILGGMWGVKKGKLNDIKNLIEKYVKGNFWQVDQNFLRDNIYPRIKDDCLVHDPFFDKLSFPTKRNGLDFVGRAFNEREEPLHPEHTEREGV
jgi:protein O-GlcNAc transferase